MREPAISLAQRGLKEHLAQVLLGTSNSQRGGRQPPEETSHFAVHSPPPFPSFVDFSSPPPSSHSQRLSLYPPTLAMPRSLPSCSWGLVDLLQTSVLAT